MASTKYCILLFFTLMLTSEGSGNGKSATNLQENTSLDNAAAAVDNIKKVQESPLGLGRESTASKFGDFAGLFNCRPFNRTFVQTGLPCRQRNMTALNCRNETCICTGIVLPTLPPFPGGGEFPFPPPPQFSVWNCTIEASTTISPVSSDY